MRHFLGVPSPHAGSSHSKVGATLGSAAILSRGNSFLLTVLATGGSTRLLCAPADRIAARQLESIGGLEAGLLMRVKGDGAPFDQSARPSASIFSTYLSG